MGERRAAPLGKKKSSYIENRTRRPAESTCYSDQSCTDHKAPFPITLHGNNHKCNERSSSQGNATECERTSFSYLIYFGEHFPTAINHVDEFTVLTSNL